MLVLSRVLGLALVVFAVWAPVLAGDIIKIGANGEWTGEQLGLLVDGRVGGSFANDQGFLSHSQSIGVGSQSNAQSNEIIVFDFRGAPTHLHTPWTNEDDVFTVNLNAEIEIDATVWIVKGPWAKQRQHANEACTRTAQIWIRERMGVMFRKFVLVDATGDPDAPNHYDFSGGDSGDAPWKALREDIGFVEGRLNIYWLDTVEGSTTWGWSNFGTQIVMGRNTGAELLSHEIGHAMSLQHTNSRTTFDVTGVMHSASDVRAHFSEGQIYRAHFRPTSIINETLQARPGQPTRTCSQGANNATCVRIDRRLWADGSFPAN